ncbi:MFS transporter [Pseudorhodoferax sp. Leaf274]|uniref:MFS transporter n=1 Tax=Pseudorhodoferax sp. Leaf274 TaxID=1736318 RepID=UPI000702A768|nr:MFS transporter [Pseudorhodoferax sp. Leaf274]KQP39927.1 transporter [Pseudorhodoferax sp. Leaf274]
MPDSHAITPALRRSILLLSLSNFSSMSVQRICDAMLPALAQEFSVSLAQAAQVVSFFAIAYGVALLFYGPLGDRFGKFKLISLCTLACSVGSVVSALAPDLAMLVLGRVLVAVAAAAMIPMALAWVGDAVSYEKRQETLALLGLGSTLGLVSGQLLGGLFTDWFGWRWAFWFLTALFGVVGALQWRDWRQQRLRPHHMAGLAGAPATRQPFGAQLLVILRRPHARAVLLTSVAQGALAFGVMAIWASHLHARLGMSLAASGASVALAGVGGVLYMVGARRLIPWLGERGLVLTGAAALSIGACGLAFTPYAGLAPLASLVAGFGLFMMQNTLQTNATQMAPEARGMGVAMFSTSLFIGQSVGVVLAASLVGRWGSTAVVAGAGVAVLGMALFFARALRRRDAAAAAAQA